MDKESLLTLKDLGLSDNEAKIYLSAIALGPSSVASIANHASIKRTSAYAIIETLKKQGLFSTEIKQWKKVYVAAHPDTLGKILEQKKRRLQATLPDLISAYNTDESKSSIKYYEGVEAIKDVYEQLLNKVKKDDYFYVIGNTQEWLKHDPAYFRSYIERREKKRVALKMLLQRTDVVEKYMKNNVAGGEIRPISENLNLTSSITITQYMIIIQTVAPPVVALAIDNRNIIQTQKEMFEMLWTGIK